MWQYLLGGAAGGAAKHFLEDKPNANKRRLAAAEQTKWSPWTGMGVGELPKEPSLIGSMFSGAAGLGSMGQSAESTETYNKWLSSKTPKDPTLDVAPSIGEAPERSSWMNTPYSYRGRVGGFTPE